MYLYLLFYSWDYNRTYKSINLGNNSQNEQQQSKCFSCIFYSPPSSPLPLNVHQPADWIKTPNSFPNWVSLKRFIGMLLNILTFFFLIFNALKTYETLLIPMAIPHRCSLGSFIGLHFNLFFLLLSSSYCSSSNTPFIIQPSSTPSLTRFYPASFLELL